MPVKMFISFLINYILKKAYNKAKLFYLFIYG